MFGSPFRKAVALFLLLLPMVDSRAELLDEEQARYAAAEFFSPTSESSRLRAKGRQMVLRSEGHRLGYYVFDRPEGGVVFVADDDAIGRTVLGYTEEGHFDADNLPQGMQDWLEQIGVLMDAVHEGKIARQEVRRKAGKSVVSALIQTSWNQGWPYNNFCPQVDGERCLTGCVATAMAQVLNYWEWPQHGYGSVTYTDTEGCGQELSEKLSAHTYDWENMLSGYPNDGFAYTDEQLTAVATLMRDCGYAVNMSYSPTESSAAVNAQTMQTYFHYSAAASDRFSGEYPEDMWHAFIQEDLLAGRPVLYSGIGVTGGHEFILDGFDTEGYYHVNWGWGGHMNGSFMLTNLNGYDFGQWMVSHLMPDRSSDAEFSYTLDDGTLTISGSGIMPDDFALSSAPWQEECQSVRRIVIEEGIQSIPSDFGLGYKDGTSYLYTNLEELQLPEGLVTIGDYAFYQAGKLTSVQLPSTLVKMDYAFAQCPALRSLHLPKGIEEYIDELEAVAELTVDEQSPFLSAEAGVLYDKSRKHLLLVPQGLSLITISEQTEHILDRDFLRHGIPVISKCMVAPSMSIRQQSQHGCIFVPYGSIGYDAWQAALPSGWRILTYNKDRIPDFKITWSLADGTLTVSGWGGQPYAEYGGENAPYYPDRSLVEKLQVGEGVTGLCTNGFDGYASLTEAELPSTFCLVGSHCFSQSALTLITCHAKQAPELEEDAFSGMPTGGTLRVPEGADYSSWLQALPEGWTIQTFPPEPLATYFTYTGESAPIYEMQAWEELLVELPNAVCIINPRYEEWAYLARNILIADASAEGGYRCPDFRLTDLSIDYTTPQRAPWTGFAPPVPFTVAKGEYRRKLYEGYNTVCLPFDISEETLPKVCRMYAFSHIDDEKGEAVFTAQTATAAGHACILRCSSGTEWQADLSGTTISTLQASTEESSMRGTFVTTEDYQGIGYNPRVKDNVFAPLDRYLHPFRACFITNMPTTAAAALRMRLDDQATGIASPLAETETQARIYNLSGQRITALQQGVNIMNGKKILK